VTRRPAFLGVVVLAALVGGSACRCRPEPETLFAEAEALRLRYEKEAARQAIARYREAQEAWKRKGDARDAARAGQRIGATYGQLGSLRESLQGYLAALSLAEGSADRLLESDLRSDVGLAQSPAADREEGLEEALRQCQMALTMARRLGGTREEAKALNCLGEVEYHRGNLQPALEFYREAEPLWDRLGDQRGQAETLFFEGWVYSDLSRFDRAQACFDRARSLWTSLGDRRGEAMALVADGRLRQRRGEYQEALNRFEEALALLQPMGDAVWEGVSLTGKGTVYLYLADTGPALRYWERALELYEAAGLKNPSADVLLSLGATYLASGDDAKALDRSERALVLARELGNRRWESFALRYIGVVYLFRHLPTPARQYFERSLEIQRSLGDPRLEAQTRADMGEAHELLGEHNLARRCFTDALALGRASGDRVGEARGLFGLGRASIGLNDLDAARRYIERSLNVVESLRTEVESRDLRASYFASVQQYHQSHMDVLMQLHKMHPREGLAAAAFEASERARARSLLDSLTEAGVDLRQGVDPDLLRREQVLKRAFADWAERRRRSSGGPGPDADAAASAGEYRDLEQRYDQVQAEIRSKSPRYAALARPQPLGLTDVQRQVLDAETLLLEYALGEERSYLWAISSRDQASYELAPRAEIERTAQSVYDRLTARLAMTEDQRDRRQRVAQADAEYWREAGRLSEMLLGPVANKMVGKRILVVADGALQYLPFAALPVPGSRDRPVPMVVEHEVVSLPSASVLAALRRETRGRKPPGKAVAVLADPVFEPDDPRLRARSDAAGRSGRQASRKGGSAAAPVAPSRADGNLAASPGTLSLPRLAATRLEADAVVAAAPEAMTLRAIGFDANRATAMSSDLAQYRIVHFATHGVLDNENPGLSGIILSMFDEQGRELDGFLSLHEIYNLKLPVELVVLSACNTALGKQVKGEGLVGVVRGFMYAGAKRVVASLWKVDDEATGELMSRFYQEMLKRNRSPAAALRQAQLAMWRQEPWRPPFYWAAFVLQGEWE
jgi:CHAT domain-containing protein/tetratricopeptide (TPR) repeat protein